MLISKKIRLEVSEQDAATLEFMQGKCRSLMQKQRTLWILTAYSDEKNVPGELCYTYAYSEAEVRQRSAAWIEAHKHLEHLDIKEYPGGFAISVHTYLPGQEWPESGGQ